MGDLEAVLKEIVDRVFPPSELPFETHWEVVQKQELLRKNLGFILHWGLASQANQWKIVRDFHDALFPSPVGEPDTFTPQKPASA